MAGLVDVAAYRAEVERAEAAIARKRAALDAYDKAVAEVQAAFASPDPSPGKASVKPPIGAPAQRDCAECGNWFVPHPRAGRKSKFCSNRCRNKVGIRARTKSRREARQRAKNGGGEASPDPAGDREPGGAGRLQDKPGRAARGYPLAPATCRNPPIRWLVHKCATKALTWG
jgi:hypothetical protein